MLRPVSGRPEDDERQGRAPRPIGGAPGMPSLGGSSAGLDVGAVQGGPSGPSLDVGAVHGGPPAAPSAPSWQGPADVPAPPDVSGGGVLGKLAEAFARKKAELLVAALVGAVAGGTAGTLGGAGAGLGAGYATSEANQSELDTPPPASDAPGSLRVLTQPAGASVAMDGHALGASPVDVRAASGMHTVALALEGYEPHEVHLSVPAGGSFTLSVPLVAIPETPDAGVEAPAPRRVGGGGGGSRRPRRDCTGERYRCESGCRDAESSCEFRCPGCSSCTTTEGWDSCRARCESCRQSCRNNRGFCEEQCETSEDQCERDDSGW